ncbi:hypothetical protein DH2020_022111 [Rehmannia glutinosa]|uniref:PAR1 protein n=1 Tax=Rehmannia glutinosa TaxID=99300 RepID=A0ABR0WFA7_REHGL
MSPWIIFLAFALFFQGAFGEVVCEELAVGMCSFSIASSGKRCLLETSDGNGFQCTTSEVITMKMVEYIESDECVRACGVDRNSVGISSDSLLENQFTLNLCSPQCYHNCPNIVDLYYNLALAEGVLLADLCKSERRSSRRSVIQLQSSGAASSSSSGPISSAAAYAPASTATFSSVDCAPPPM